MSKTLSRTRCCVMKQRELPGKTMVKIVIFYVGIHIRKLLSLKHICKQFAVSVKTFLQIKT